jgi:hypothetical protein
MPASGGAEAAVAHRACSATMSCRYTSSSSAVSTIGQVQANRVYLTVSVSYARLMHETPFRARRRSWDLQGIRHGSGPSHL